MIQKNQTKEYYQGLKDGVELCHVEYKGEKYNGRTGELLSVILKEIELHETGTEKLL